MASADWKDAIVQYFSHWHIQTSSKDWKRVAKGTLPNGETYREFHNAVVGRTVYTLGDDADDGYALLEKDQWIYGTFNADPTERANMGTGDFILSFEPLDRWQRSGYIYDQHQQYLLQAFFNLPDDIDEDMENSFSYQDGVYNPLTIHMELKRLGFQYSQELTDFLNNQTPPPKRGASAPVNPPTPPAFNKLAPVAKPVPTVMHNGPGVAPMVPPAPASQLGGYYGTGLQADGSAKPGDFLACVVEDDGEVLVKISPLLDFCAGNGFDQNVGPLVDHLLPCDWDETSEQTYIPDELSVVEAYEVVLKAGFNVDLPAYKKQFARSYDVYDVTAAQHQANLAAIANPTIIAPVAHVNPIAQGTANATYPDLSGQLPEVQEALEKQRQMGLLGLDQENANWLDMDEIKDKTKEKN